MAVVSITSERDDRPEYRFGNSKIVQLFFNYYHVLKSIRKKWDMSCFCLFLKNTNTWIWRIVRVVLKRHEYDQLKTCRLPLQSLRSRHIGFNQRRRAFGRHRYQNKSWLPQGVPLPSMLTITTTSTFQVISVISNMLILPPIRRVSVVLVSVP